HRSLWFLLISLLWLGWFLLPGLLKAEESTAVVASAEASTGAQTTVSLEALQTRLKEVEDNSGLEEKQKQALVKEYKQALADLKAAESFEASYRGFVQAQAEAPLQTQVLNQALAMDSPKVTPADLGLAETSSLAELEKLLALEQSKRLQLESALTDSESNLKKQANRATQARQRLEEARQQLRQLAEAQAPLAGEDSPDLLEAKELAREVLQRALQAEIKALDQELLSQPVRLELLRAQQDQNARALVLATELVDSLRALTDKRRLDEAQQAAAQAEEIQQSAADKHPLIANLAEQNTQLAAQISQTVKEMEAANGLILSVREQVKHYSAELQSLDKKLEYAGLSGTLGRALFEKRRSLPNRREINSRLAKREQTTAEVGLRQLSYSEDRRRLADLGLSLQALLGDMPQSEQALIEPELRSLLTARKDLLEQAISRASAYMQTLVELDFAERELLTELQRFDDLLAENLLWIPSSEGVGFKALLQIPADLLALLAWQQWFGLAAALIEVHAFYPLLLLGVLVFAVLLYLAPRLRTKVIESGQQVGNPFNDHIGSSLRALLWVLVRALSWPLLLMLLGLQWQAVAGDNGFVAAAGRIVIILSPIWLQLRFFWILCEPQGVALRHFRWSSANVRLLRKELNLLMWLMLPAGFLNAVAGQIQGSVINHLFFIGGVVAIGLFLGRILHPHKGLPAMALRLRPQGLAARMRYLWYAMLLALPAAMVILIWLGYFYTAGSFVLGLIHSLLLLFGLIIMRELILRWLLLRLVAARRAVLEREREEARSKNDEPEPAGEMNMLPRVEEPELDLEALDKNTRKLLNTAFNLGLVVGLWVIWAPLLPAFNVFNEVELWRYSVTAGTEVRQIPVTLGSLVLAGLTALITMVAARNLPSVLEIVLLKQLAVDAGARYAYTTLIRYLVVGIGATLFFSLLGGRWSEIQWLVAALGVGIGFGLQEIVANFISGIIILFERPIRVGDVVTVGNVSGVVTRIRIRATTITNWDRQELLVPNKEFITNQLLNWTLSDQVTRITIAVGIDYGSDVGQALRLVEEAAKEHENVLEDPAPLITLEGFGDNTLNLLMRCYLPSLERRVSTMSELHQAIYHKLNEAGISIAFPQRDVHLDTRNPLQVQIIHT
ncbi:MAG: mechanosensitive ion channel, partial [Gammaproteobacteria bacterium]|nr:mechanosensitive ion channel [Gammaproteobacteria bacterium]